MNALHDPAHVARSFILCAASDARKSLYGNIDPLEKAFHRGSAFANWCAARCVLVAVACPARDIDNICTKGTLRELAARLSPQPGEITPSPENPT